ncbi:uncharacterized protein CC84DRAFT_1179318 [Paraphaeosphaeria sporulosa]|uniref:Uncharacterized protein n=1 Tax=Paraphaeosphaeria sporulosa TaxID=1460663 RepID=A0A177C6A2_9PLEO|nr:uncharacterized protein CC84DRAFT_1179318 [Paraphaeosphaeria sporulosa]OAG02409.1 hypothetical protein CC84DRAFT_1179318 [Paraphaeosphaeria sporulosa]
MLMLNTSPDDIGRVDPLPDAQEHNESSPSNGTTTLSLPCSPRSIQPPNPDHTPSLPSLYKNHLTIRKLSFYAARIQNALHLGLPTFLAQKDNDISPWYWHTQFSLLITSSSTSPTNPSRSAPATFSNYGFAPTRPIRCQPCFNMSASVSPDLSPTPLQRSHAHGMYLDVVPFPVFRDRAITLLAMQPPAFEEAELKRDMEDGGLVVWGAGHGKAGGALVRDRRNWECAGWFWRKWRLLVEGSGLEEQSRWWRDMRGEEDEFGEL